MGWNLEGLRIEGFYLNEVKVIGKVESSRVKYGGTVDHVAQVEFLTCDGMFHNSDEPDALSEQVKNFLQKHAELVKSDFPKVEKNSAGYHLDSALRPNGSADLARLFTGSEGSLGLITRCRLRTVPIPEATALALLYFRRMEDALEAALTLKLTGVAACELVDKVLLDLHEAAQKTPGNPKVSLKNK